MLVELPSTTTVILETIENGKEINRVEGIENIRDEWYNYYSSLNNKKGFL
jgi:hypothetical protein